MRGNMLLLIGLIIALTGGLVAMGIIPLQLSTTVHVGMKNSNLWIIGKFVEPGQPAEIIYVFRYVGSYGKPLYKLYSKFYRKYNVARDSYAMQIVYDGRKPAKFKVLVIRVVVNYDWDPDNVKQFKCNHWHGQGWKTDMDGWAQNIEVNVYASVYWASISENGKILYLVRKVKDVSWDEIANNRIALLRGPIYVKPGVLNTIFTNGGHSSDSYEIILYPKHVEQNGQVVWNQDAPRVYRVILDCSWKGFHYELWPAKIVWNDKVLYDSLGSTPTTTTVWSPIVTSYPGGGEIPGNASSTSVTTTKVTSTPVITGTTTATLIINQTTTTYTTTSIITITVSPEVNIEGNSDNVLYGAVMSFLGLAMMVFGFRR